MRYGNSRYGMVVTNNLLIYLISPERRHSSVQGTNVWHTLITIKIF